MKKMYTAKGWRGEDVEVYRQNTRIVLVCNTHIVSYKVPTSRQDELMKDLISLTTFMESLNDNGGTGMMGHSYFSDEAASNNVRLAKAMREVETQLIFGRQY